MTNDLTKMQLAFVGCGVMAESMIAGLLRKNLVKPEQIVGSHPRANRREDLTAKYGIRVFETMPKRSREIRENENSIVALCVKPQRLNGVLQELKVRSRRIKSFYQSSRARKSKRFPNLYQTKKSFARCRTRRRKSARELRPGLARKVSAKAKNALK
jgi:hypothetical protein